MKCAPRRRRDNTEKENRVNHGSRQKWITLTLLTTAAILAWLGCRSLFQPSSTDTARFLARAETEMWQAYYKKGKVRLAWLLIQVLRRQFGISMLEAARTGKLLADAAMKFKTAKPGQYHVALPDLTAAYTRLKEYTGRSFAPGEAAGAELAWWVDRRTPGRQTVEIVGTDIGHLYEVIYGFSHPGFIQAGLLRARAAHVRDQGGEQCDWKEVEELLHRSYRTLLDTAARGPAPSGPGHERATAAPSTGADRRTADGGRPGNSHP